MDINGQFDYHKALIEIRATLGESPIQVGDSVVFTRSMREGFVNGGKVRAINCWHKALLGYSLIEGEFVGAESYEKLAIKPTPLEFTPDRFLSYIWIDNKKIKLLRVGM